MFVATRHGIVIGADGKVVYIKPHRKLQPPSAGIATKIVLIGNKVAVAQCGVESIGSGGVTPYSFSSLAEYLQSNSSSKPTVIEIVTAMQRRLSQIFDGFDVILKSGTLKREYLPPPEDTFLKLYVAGYENGHPLAYVVQLDIDWSALHLKDPTESAIYPNPRRKNLSLTWTGGPRHGIIELATGIETDETKFAVKTMPTEIAALRGDSDITLGEMLTLVRGLLDLEVRSNPDTIGYPLTIFTIRQSGTRKHTYTERYH